MSIAGALAAWLDAGGSRIGQLMVGRREASIRVLHHEDAGRTDLDVSLPLDQADIRVRRAGLDLDPGWLPWFGRVVRFHYLFRGEFRA